MEVKCTVCGKVCQHGLLHLVWEVSDFDERGDIAETSLISAADLCGSCSVLFNTIFLGPSHVPSETLYLRSSKPDTNGPVEGPHEEDGTPPARVSEARVSEAWESGDLP